jgi:Na+/proline symporter
MLGFAGRSYRAGGTYVVSILFMALAIAVMTIYGPRLVKLSRTFGYITPADYIYHRFGSHSLRVICVVLFCWGLANYILEQLVAMGHAVEGLSGGDIPFMAGVLLLVIVMLVYESLGGMRSVAWTDAVQGVILLGGCGAILFIILTQEGGLPAASAIIVEEHPAKLQAPDVAGLRSWVSTILLLGFGVSVYPHAIQRMFAARSLKTLRWSLSGMAFMPFATTMLAFIIGIISISRYPDLSTLESDKVTIYMLGEIINMNAFTYWMGVMVFVALVAAIMSTSDSALLSIQSMVTKDLYKAYLKPDATPEHLLRVGKIFGWALMAVLVTFAWISIKTESSIWLLIKLKLEFMVQIAPVFVLGVYWRRLPAGAVLLGVCTGTAITLTLWGGAAFGFWDAAQRSPWNISAGVWGLAANFAICIVGGLTSRGERVPN